MLAAVMFGLVGMAFVGMLVFDDDDPETEPDAPEPEEDGGPAGGRHCDRTNRSGGDVMIEQSSR